MSLQRLPSERLVARRRKRRRRALLALLIFVGIILGVLIWGSWQETVRISRVEIYGLPAGRQALISEIATDAMQGSYFGVIPRNSTFFLPSQSIRDAIVSRYPDIAAVSIFRSGLSGLSIKVDYRVPIARWCGDTPLPEIDTSRCYLFDAGGFIYATTSSVSPLNSLVLYESASSTIGSTLPNAEKLPATFDFARELATFGSTVSSIVIHDGEVDEYLASGTRITYVLGDEQNAFTALTSARKNFNLADGSLAYIDLRFGGKMYLKKK